MELFATPEEFCRFLWHEYLEERRYDILYQVVDDDLSVIGTGGHEVSHNLEEFARAMARESTEWNGAFMIRSQWYQSTKLAEDVYLVIGELEAKEDSRDGILYDVQFRFSLVVRRRADGWRVVHVHQSVPDPNQAMDEFFPHRMVEKNGQQVIYNLRHDSLTGALNRLYLEETVGRYMGGMGEGLMLMVDIDKFKGLNDTYGHPVGDKALILLTQCLKSAFPKAAVGRIGGDEFVVYLPEAITPEALTEALAGFRRDWEEGQRPLELHSTLTVSTGIARYPRDGEDYHSVWTRADEALYVAKKQGGGRSNGN